MRTSRARRSVVFARVLTAAIALAGTAGSRAQLFAATSFAPFPISVTPGRDWAPKTDGRYVVWTDVSYLGGPTSTNDVFGYDLVLGQRFTLANGNRYQDEPTIDGGVALWTDWTPGSTTSADILGRNLAGGGGGGTFTVSAAPGSQSAHEISGNLVVWHDNRNGTSQIWGRRLDQPVGSDFPISSTTATDVSGNTVVWMSHLEPGDQGNIYARDVNGGSVFPVTTNAAYQYFPRISGRNVVWNDWRDGSVRIYGRNLDAGGDFPISSGVASQFQAAIDGDLVVWRDDRSGVSDIWGRYLSGGPEFQITDTPGLWEDNPQVSGSLVVWQQSVDGNNTDIYGTYVPEPTGALFLVLAANRRILARRRRSHA